MDIQEIISICKKATSGPWIIKDTISKVSLNVKDPSQTSGYKVIAYMGSGPRTDCSQRINNQRDADALFIITARDILLELTRENYKLREENIKLKSILSERH